MKTVRVVGVEDDSLGALSWGRTGAPAVVTVDIEFAGHKEAWPSKNIRFARREPETGDQFQEKMSVYANNSAIIQQRVEGVQAIFGTTR